MFDLNPLNLPDAAWQHGIMLLVAGVLGFLIGYTSRQRLTKQLETDIARAQRDLDDPRRPGLPTVGTDADDWADKVDGVYPKS